jgi:hypothetical protein
LDCVGFYTYTDHSGLWWPRTTVPHQYRIDIVEYRYHTNIILISFWHRIDWYRIDITSHWYHSDSISYRLISYWYRIDIVLISYWCCISIDMDIVLISLLLNILTIMPFHLNTNRRQEANTAVDSSWAAVDGFWATQTKVILPIDSHELQNLENKPSLKCTGSNMIPPQHDGWYAYSFLFCMHSTIANMITSRYFITQTTE